MIVFMVQPFALRSYQMVTATAPHMAPTIKTKPSVSYMGDSPLPDGKSGIPNAWRLEWCEVSKRLISVGYVDDMDCCPKTQSNKLTVEHCSTRKAED